MICTYVCDWICENPPCMHKNWIAFYNGHTSALSRHSNKTAIDKQVYFYRLPFVNPVRSRRTIIDPVRPLRGINRVAWDPFLFHCTSAQLVVWSRLLWPSVWPTVHTIWSAMSTGIVNPPTHPSHPLKCGTCDVAGCVQNVSQNQPDQPVAIYVSVMIAIALLYFWCKSYVATTKHK